MSPEGLYVTWFVIFGILGLIGIRWLFSTDSKTSDPKIEIPTNSGCPNCGNEGLVVSTEEYTTEENTFCSAQGATTTETWENRKCPDCNTEWTAYHQTK